MTSLSITYHDHKNTSVHRKDVAATMSLWATSTPETMSSLGRDTTRVTETARRHCLENHAKDLNAVQALELKLGIQQRWQPGSTEWQNAGRLVAMRRYQKALDTLEGLIVAQMFEFAKMNRSQTGEYAGQLHSLFHSYPR